MKHAKWLAKYGEEGENVVYQEGRLWLTNSNLYLEGLQLKKIALGNIKEVKHSAMEGSFSLDIISIVDKPNQIESLQGLNDAVKTRRLINEAIAKLPITDRLIVTQEVVLNEISLEIPRSELSNDQELKNKLNKAVGEKDADWLWVHKVEAKNPHRVYVGFGVAFILMGVVAQSLYTGDYGTAIMMTGMILMYLFFSVIPLLVINKYTMFGITHNRIVALSKDAKKVEQIAISSIQTNEIERQEGESTLKIETSRKKISIPRLKFDKEVQTMIENLKKNSDELRFLD